MCATIGIDIDDTLYDFGRLAREILSEEARYEDEPNLRKRLQAAAYAPWTEWRTPADLLPMEVWWAVIERCHKDEVIFEQALFPGCFNVLWKLIESGHKIIYISNRDGQCSGATAGWIERCGLPNAGVFDALGDSLDQRVQIVCTSDSKLRYLTECQYIIDDRPKTLVEFVYDKNWAYPDTPRKAFGLHRSYNSSLTDVPGIYLAPSWFLLDHYLTAKGVINPAAIGASDRT